MDVYLVGVGMTKFGRLQEHSVILLRVRLAQRCSMPGSEPKQSRAAISPMRRRVLWKGSI